VTLLSHHILDVVRASICIVTDDWSAQVPADAAEKAEELAAALRHLGCVDPSGWVRSEIAEGIPQVARYRFLSRLWPELIDGWQTGISHVPAAQRAVEAGASREDLVGLARVVAYETVFAMLVHLDVGGSDGSVEGLPSWNLVEADPGGSSTGRGIGGLYEDLLGFDPSGREGQDLGT
jgi:hypothetical protein